MRSITFASIAASAYLAGCAASLPPEPRQGTIPAPAGGASGYQHGGENSKFVVGATSRRTVQHGYLKQIGAEGTFAINMSNGSAFGVPNALAAARLPPYGDSPQAHDAYVREYFAKLGLPAEQIKGVHAMTLLEAAGASDESVRTIPRVVAYYTVVDRAIGDVPVPDSFAWARANADGRIVQEGVYWPALPASVVAEARQLKEVLANPERSHDLESHLPVDSTARTVTIRHAAATEERFEAFASLDVTVLTSPALAGVRPEQPSNRSTSGAAAVTHHFDVSGAERRLPQERFELKDRYPARKGGCGDLPRPCEAVSRTACVNALTEQKRRCAQHDSRRPTIHAYRR